MTKIEGTVFCDNCGVEITWAPIVADNHHYCCQDCHDHLQCDCRPAIDWEEDDQPRVKDLSILM
jgi:hypothetical protein